MAIYHHYASTDEDPQHFFCPLGPTTWCQYNLAIENDEDLDEFSHEELVWRVDLDKWERVLPIFKDLTNENLLRRCAKDYRQNVNESFNSLIWIRVPKTVYHSLDSISLGMYDAVICCNLHYSGRLKVLDELTVSYSQKCVKGSDELDKLQDDHRGSGKSRAELADVSDEEDLGDGDYFSENEYEAGLHE